MKTNLFLIAAVCRIVAPSIVCMEQGVVNEPKSLVKTIVEKMLCEYEDRLFDAKNADERNAIMKEYRQFFARAANGAEALEEMRKEILWNGIPQEPKAICFKAIHIRTYFNGQRYCDLKIMDAADKTIQYINISSDPCNAYDILNGIISPDGKLIAILLRECNKRRFMAVYKNAPSGTLEYIAAAPWKITQDTDMPLGNKANEFLLLNILSASEKPYKVPQLTVQKKSSLRESQKWSMLRAMALASVVLAVTIKRASILSPFALIRSAVKQLSNLFKK